MMRRATGGETGREHTGRYRRTMKRHGGAGQHRSRRGDTGSVLASDVAGSRIRVYETTRERQAGEIHTSGKT